ncbi:DUF2809 domain-containing protein [Pedobacter frigiditerrae]|uniref:DUF2809 domain-containing protein n=1 Tax=Pedobacter frigiditerrae TaxID=2530452 RepID=A0A4R0MWL0_9SPHI|nr:DUF2809 domain-containing protein [Pedobacter frigiditerrae]TCC90324.1 DUF2809 domain-containing protein [Pedobacter frigiditerrae]
MKFTFNLFYFIWSSLLLGVEIIIGFFIRDNWIRAYFGDFLVVILLYCLIKSFSNTKVSPTLFWVLMFSYLIETLQYFRFVELIGLQHIPLANTLIGTYFSWLDMLMYTLGVCFVAIIELLRRQHQTENELKMY